MNTLINRTLKMLSILTILVLFTLILNLDTVTASTEVNEDYLKELINKMPDTVDLNINENEYKKSSEIIRTALIQKLNDEGVSTYYDEQYNKTKLNDLTISNDYEIELKVSYLGVLHGYEGFYDATISFSKVKNNTTYGPYLATKNIKLNYKNTNEHNSEDEQFVKNLQINHKTAFEVDLDYLKNKKQSYDNFPTTLENYYKDLINDSSIDVKFSTGATDGSNLNYFYEEGSCLAIFKNNVLYDIRPDFFAFLIPILTVPSDIADNELEDYVKSEISKYDKYLEISNFSETITSIEKGIITSDNRFKLDIENAYTIFANNSNYSEDYIIIKRDKLIDKTDLDTNIRIETTTDVIPSGTTLVAEKVTSGDNYNIVVKALGDNVTKFEMFDISLVSNNAKIQPDGNVTVSIPIPSGFDTSKIVVYYIAEDGTKTKYETVVKDGYVVFETDHFSNYVVAEETASTTKVSETTSDSNTTTSTETETTNTTNKLDNTPKTGEERNITSIVTTIISLVSAIGLVIIKTF